MTVGTSGVMERLGCFIVRRRKSVLAATVLAVVASAAIGLGVAEHLSPGGLNADGSESDRADRILAEDLGVPAPNVVFLVAAPEGASVDDPAIAEAGSALTAQIAAEPGVTGVNSYWSTGLASLRNDTGDRAIIVAALPEPDDNRETTAELLEHIEGAHGPLTVQAGGFAALFTEASDRTESDLATAEAIALPITLVLLVVIFGSVVASALPLGVGVVAILGSLAVLRILSATTEVSVFVMSFTSVMGLGLAIDYSLFIVSRFREEMASGRSPHDAAVATVVTAGRTVAFSALAVAVSLSALLVFPMFFLRSFAYAGSAVVLIAGAAAVVSLPALLSVLGHRVEKLSVRRNRQSLAGGSRLWRTIAHAVMRRPVAVIAVVGALLVAVGLPFLRAEVGQFDYRTLPQGSQTRQVSETFFTEFGSAEESSAITIVAPAGDGVTAESIDAYARRMSAIDGVARVDARTGSYIAGDQAIAATPLHERFAVETGTWLAAVPGIEPFSPEGEELVTAIRSLEAPFEVLVGGGTAGIVDVKAAIADSLPGAGVFMLVAILVLLFLMTGSVLVPIKAVVLNLLSLTAVFGGMVWIFQDGNLSGLLDFTPTGNLFLAMPILMFCIAFGLSMDYEVFVLSRIKEEYDRTGDNEASVAASLERTGRIVTAAALLISVIFLVQSLTSGLSYVKLFGLGLATAVLVDATLIRATLVPAIMRLAGDANWWAPAPLRRLHDRIGLNEAVAVAGTDPTIDRPAQPVGHAPPATSATATGHPATAPRRDRPLHAERERATTGPDKHA